MTIGESAPDVAAKSLLDEQDEQWVAALVDELHHLLRGRQLERVARLWDLSRTELGTLFGVSRQAASRWVAEGIPADRAGQVADVAAITDLLERYLKRDRIPAVVRREAAQLDDRSLFEVVATGGSSEALRLTRRMFTFSDVHA